MSFLSISYAGDSDSFYGLPPTSNMLFMQELIDGYNLKYNFSCTYKNLSGATLNCDKGITD